MSSKDEDEDECSGCGSSYEERKARAQRYPDDDIPLGLTECPHCGAEKCCFCNMGDDVECGNCP